MHQKVNNILRHTRNSLQLILSTKMKNWAPNMEGNATRKEIYMYIYIFFVAPPSMPGAQAFTLVDMINCCNLVYLTV